MPPLEEPEEAQYEVGTHETVWHKRFGWLARYLAEFLGTFLLSFTVTCNFKSPSNARDNPTWEPTANACMLMVAVYSLGPISGAHLNPAVSLATGLANKGSWKVICRFVIAQFLGGIFGGLSAMWLYSNVERPAHAPPALGPHRGPHGFEFDIADCLLVEMLFTCLLCFVYLNVTLARQNNPVQEGNHFYGLAIGFAYLAGGYSASCVSGGYFNPAVTVGIDFASFSSGFGYGLAYTFVQLIGGTLAALIFRIVRPAEQIEERAFRSFESSLHEKCLCEVFGTFFLMFVMGLNENAGAAHRQIKPWACAAVVVAMVYSIADISGGYLNPAITIAVGASGRAKLSKLDCVAYIVSQTWSAIVGALMYSKVYHGRNRDLLGGNYDSVTNVYPGHNCTRLVDGDLVSEPCSMNQMVLVESIFTFVLVFTVLSTSVVKGIVSPLRRNYYYGLAIGMTIAAGGFAVGSVSGGVLNPSLAVAISFAGLMDHGDFWPCATFSAAQISAGLCAVLLFCFTHVDQPGPPLKKEEEEQQALVRGEASSGSAAAALPRQAAAASLLEGAQVKQPKQGKQAQAGPRGRRGGAARGASPSPV